LRSRAITQTASLSAASRVGSFSIGMRRTIPRACSSIRATRLWAGSLAQTVSPAPESPTAARPPGAIPRIVISVLPSARSSCLTVRLSLFPTQTE
jgi:hypothetical protein